MKAHYVYQKKYKLNLSKKYLIFIMNPNFKTNRSNTILFIYYKK